MTCLNQSTLNEMFLLAHVHIDFDIHWVLEHKDCCVNEVTRKLAIRVYKAIIFRKYCKMFLFLKCVDQTSINSTKAGDVFTFLTNQFDLASFFLFRLACNQLNWTTGIHEWQMCYLNGNSISPFIFSILAVTNGVKMMLR